MPLTYQLPLGILLALLIAFIAHRAHSLNRGGAFAATFVGTIIFGIGGWQWAILLLTFFITSSALSRAFNTRKQGVSEKYSKGHERDAGQVLGNGGIATLFAGLHFFYPEAAWPWIGFAASLAAVNADTWATELGVLSPDQPRMITDLIKVVERGTSGGISFIGTLASLAGAALIGILTSILGPQPATISTGLIVSLAGLAGSLFDSLLGATVQAMYFCPKDKRETEKHPLHTCGTQTIHIRGWKWLNNDWVNFACGAAGTTIALITSVLTS
jgi:uncharacterized protein (TIGR00297 family)